MKGLSQFAYNCSKIALLCGSLSALTQTAAFGQTIPPEGSAASSAPQASSDSAGPSNGDIIVTANKRAQNLQEVGITIQAVGAERIANQQIESLKDIALAVPGLTFAQTANATPVYTLRGVGFFDSTLASYPDVSLYLDQVPLPFPTTATLTAFDLERFEVLKGPQGTLFGNNATGGAINYIAAKPQNSFGAGVDLGLSRFNTVDLSAFVTGPLSDTLNARLAVKAVSGDPWQKSYTRDDKLGKASTLAARLLLDWRPTDRLTVSLNLNSWRDKSDPQAPQYSAFRPVAPVTPTFPVGNIPLAPGNSRAADWDPDLRPFANNSLVQSTIRIDYDLSESIALTSITSYIDYRHRQFVEGDGTALASLDTPNAGRIKSFSQELRLNNGGRGAFRWVVGANYEHSNVNEFDAVLFPAASTASSFFYQAGNFSYQKMRNYAGFANVEYDIAPILTVKAGVRQTRANRRNSSGNVDLGDGGNSAVLNGAWNAYRAALGLGGPQPIPGVGVHYDYSLAADPATGLQGIYNARLNEDSTSWSAGLDVKPAEHVLLYANISRGFKAGGFPALSAASWAQLAPVTQEKLTDYEAGFKIQALDRRLTLNGAVFYYDYRNKQLRAKIVDAFFGILDGIVNVPKSSIKGADLDVSFNPVEGLSLSTSLTYLQTKVTNYIGTASSHIDPVTGFNVADTASFAGLDLPLTPKWQTSTAIHYKWTLGQSHTASLGANMNYQSRSDGVLVLSNRELYNVKGRAVVGFHAGVATADDRWKLTVWGKNIFDKYYWTNAITAFDTVVRYTGRPAEYGVTLAMRM